MVHVLLVWMTFPEEVSLFDLSVPTDDFQRIKSLAGKFGNTMKATKEDTDNLVWLSESLDKKPNNWDMLVKLNTDEGSSLVSSCHVVLTGWIL